MAATFTLAQTTLVNAVGPLDNDVLLASISSVRPGMVLFITAGSGLGEAVLVREIGVAGWLRVSRGFGPTAGMIHSSGDQVFIAVEEQLYEMDPGSPAASPYVNPWINLANSKVWFLYGDESGPRWWSEQTTAHGFGALGVRTTTITGAQP